MKYNYKWKKTTGSNKVIHFDDFYISYLADSRSTISNIFNGDDNESETAIIKDSKFYILKGDYRKEYELALQAGNNDFEYCIYSVFLNNQ